MNVAAKYQTFNKRWLASVIDSLIFLPFSLMAFNYERANDLESYIIYSSLHVLLFTLYLVIGHAKYGQTLGKAVVRIKVFDVDEESRIGFKRAFLRESIWFFAQVVGLVYLAFSNSGSIEQLPLQESYFTSIVGGISTLWLLLEIVTMAFNARRRALHDLIAGSVVLNLAELEREKLFKRREEFLASLRPSQTL